MKPVSRRLKRHYGVTAKRVAVRSQRPWYWRLLIAGLLILLGYFIGYWHLAGGDFGSLTNNVLRLVQENRALQAKIVHSERQLQVERAAQSNLAKELASMQDEDMRLKEDVAFYKSILNENTGAGELKMHSFKLSKGAQANQFNYHIFLVRSGRRDKIVRGSLKLALSATQAGKSVMLPLGDGVSAGQEIKINFKYYQRVEGSFTLPNDIVGHAVHASFTGIGANQPRISQRVDLPS